MRRRRFIVLLGGAAASWPLAGRAQPTSLPVIGFLSSLSPPVTTKRIAMFSRGLGEAGHGVGRKVAIEVRHAYGQYDRLPALAAELVARRVKLIAALAPPAAHAAKSATASIPIVFVGAFDPVKAGLVASLNRPGGNVTGVTFVSARLGAKRLELLRELLPRVASIALLTNPNSPDALEELGDIEAAARAFGQRLLVFRAANDREIDAAFAALVEQRAEALMVGSDPYLFQRSDQIVALAARHAVPAVYQTDEEVASGGLMSYGASIPEAWHVAGLSAAKILEGETAANLPVQQSTKVHLTINLKTAKALGLAVPQSILVRADEVIE